jgi:hypothetical protein
MEELRVNVSVSTSTLSCCCGRLLTMEGEADFHAKQLFLSGSYAACISTINSAQSPSPDLLTYAARSHLALAPPQTSQALSLVANIDTPSVRAVKLLAALVADPSQSEAIVAEALELASAGQPGTLAVVGTILHLAGETEEALNVLAQGTENQDQERCAASLGSTRGKRAQSGSSTASLCRSSSYYLFPGSTWHGECIRVQKSGQRTVW